MVLQLSDDEIDSLPSLQVFANKLCQMANGAIYDDDKAVIHVHDRKLDALEDVIESINGQAGACGILVQARL